ncbi:MAG: HepT-like ribonuclease domain-containing protein [Rubrivivax sp.]
MRQDLDNDRMLLFALVRAIEIVGEAAKKVSVPMRAAVPGLHWDAIVGMRNQIVHAYLRIDNDIVWKTATVELPPLLAMLRQTLAGS